MKTKQLRNTNHKYDSLLSLIQIPSNWKKLIIKTLQGLPYEKSSQATSNSFYFSLS